MYFDLAISYTWIYDTEFTRLIEKRFQNRNLKTFIITRHNCSEVTELVRENKLHFKAYLDRASDEDENFSELAQILHRSECRIINDYSKVDESVDKSVVQQKLIDAGLKIPYTLIIPPYDEQQELNLSEEKLQNLGKPFIVKPAYYSGGSEGVYKNVFSVDEIHNIRRENSDDNYLIQKKIYPTIIHDNRAWFRVLWAFGKVIPMLWDDEFLLYSETNYENLNPELIERINEMMNKIYSVAQLDYFSSEFALTDENEFYLIDYVNDQCDMRLKSNHLDGVPDHVVDKFIDEMIEFVKNL